MPGFIQIVEYESSDIEGVINAARSVPVPDGVPRPISVAVVADRDRPGHYATILRFDSYEAAMRHSESEATGERIGRIAPFMEGAPRFTNLDVLDETEP